MTSTPASPISSRAGSGPARGRPRRRRRSLRRRAGSRASPRSRPQRRAGSTCRRCRCAVACRGSRRGRSSHAISSSLCLDLAAALAEEHAAQHDVLPPGRLGIHAEADVEHRRDLALGLDPAAGGFVDPRDDAQERRLAGTVVADKADAGAVLETCIRPWMARIVTLPRPSRGAICPPVAAASTLFLNDRLLASKTGMSTETS